MVSLHTQHRACSWIYDDPTEARFGKQCQQVACRDNPRCRWHREDRHEIQVERMTRKGNVEPDLSLNDLSKITISCTDDLRSFTRGMRQHLLAGSFGYSPHIAKLALDVAEQELKTYAKPRKVSLATDVATTQPQQPD